MDLRIISPAQDDLRNALSEDRDYFHDHEVIHGLKDQSFDIRPSEAAKFSPGAECTSTGGSNSEYQDDPIVIVGMACRLPGGISSPRDLWEMLIQKKSGQCKVPKSRFNIEGFYHPEGDRAGAMNTDGGYFLQGDVREFDNSFFGINNLEATYMDPQQRKLLEVVYECFESSGSALDTIAGANVGVYVGNFTVDFQTMQARDSEYLHRYSATGSGTAILANRISHVFDLKGPSFTLDTACSSSIYCLHNAVTALEDDECDAAIVAGANLVTAPEQHLGTMKGGVLSATSTSHTFDASADGYGRAEGVGALYLKRLSTALRDGDPIRAVVRATAINANGKTPGITQPSITGQEEVIRKTYEKAGLNFEDTSYVECHGTGTPVGDPIEVEALSRVFSQKTGRPLLIGGIKTNLGHSEAASGISSIIKAVLAFEHGKIPATFGITRLNPKIPFEKYNMKVVTDAMEWPTEIRRVSINSFGYGGANSHAIVESVDSVLPGYRQSIIRGDAEATGKSYVLPFSASAPSSLEARVSDLAERIQKGESYHLDDLCYTLANRRSHLNAKGFLVAREATTSEDFSAEKLIVRTESSPCLSIGFVFTGQGAQWPQMGKELLKNNPVFLDRVRYLDSVLKKLPEFPPWTLEAAILEPAATSKVSEVTHSQTLCTAIQIGIVDILRTWNIEPSVVVGHSSGEIAAAYTAGLLNAAQAIVAAYYRGYAVGRATSKGTMIAAGISNEDAEKIITDKSLQGQVTVACVNSPENVTLSGNSEGIDEIFTELQEKQKFARKLHTGSRAYHSYMMQEVGNEYEHLLATGLRALAGESVFPEKPVKMFSSVGKSHETLECFSRASKSRLGSGYWRKNLENPVQFHAALKNISTTGKYHLIEIGPHSALQLPIKQIRTSLGIAENELPYHPTLSRDKDSDTCLKMLAGHLYLYGHKLNFLNVNTIEMPIKNASGSVLHDLPPYRWHYSQLLWSEPRSSSEFRNRQYVRHELLGSEIVAGNGIEHGWRNILKLKEIPWLEDHKLESTIVFPAAGYLAMAIEAISQIKNSSHSPRALPSFKFHNVNIQSALVVRQDDNETELFTSVRAEQISTASTSNTWFEFSISSYHEGSPTQHCVGIIGLGSSVDIPGTIQVDATDYDTWSMGRWYEKLSLEGLCFGPAFQSLASMKTDKAHLKPEALSTTTLVQRTKMANTSSYPGTFYAVHPLVIDSCLQAAIMGGTAGNVETLKAYMPVFINHCQINQPAAEQVGLRAYIHSKSQTTGFGTKKISVTLRDTSNRTIIDISNARLSLYRGNSEDVESTAHGRHPCLRIVWKPDIARIDDACQPQLEAYVQRFVKTRPDLADNHSVGVAAALLDLVGHKNPRLRALELGRDCDCKSRQWLDILDSKSAFTRYRDYRVGDFAEDGQLFISHVNHLEKSEKYPLDTDSSGAYDVVILPNKATTNEYWQKRAQSIMKLLNPQSVLIGRSSHTGEVVLKNNGYTVIQLSGDVMLARTPQKLPSYQGRTVLLLVAFKSPSPLTSCLKEFFSKFAEISSIKEYTLRELDTVDVPEKSIVVSCLEMKDPLLPVMSPDEMDFLRRVTDKATDLLWLTGAAMLDGKTPDLTLASGLSRALMLEQPALRFAILDIGVSADDISSKDNSQIHRLIEQALIDIDTPDDKEFVQSNGLLHVSRFVPDEGLNSHFSQRMNHTPVTMTLEEASPARLAIEKVGLMDTIYFQQESEADSKPPAGFVDIDVKAVSLNAKDIYVLSGKVETRAGTSAIEFGGVVKAIGPDVDELSPGDRVVVLAPNSFRTTERVPAWGCLKILPEEDFETMPTLPVIYGTALYALEDRANLRAGETILIHSGAGAFGMASIEIAQKIGAKVFTTVSTDDKKEFLVNRFGLPKENIFQSRNTTFVDGIQAATAGRGVDVVLNSLTGDLLHASWTCCANFGRFIEVGKRDIVDAGKLDMQVFSRNVTFSAFDLTELYYHEDQFYRNIWINKFKEAVALYRAKEIRPVPIKVFDVSEITQAYRFFSGKNRIGKVVVSLQNPKSLIPAVKSKYLATFDPKKSYLLIGCLGGLGRSLSSWMFSRGARNFTFLGRSGCDKQNARELVESLEKSGASVKVVRGDVVNKQDVIKAVTSCDLPIGGVVQASMGLHEALFSNMTHKAWHTGIQPKWRGTWNIHHALQGHDDQLEFFLLTSSVSGSVGTATESNYCSANGFLDAFARHRRSLGKPICSLGLGMISEVGYLHENPEIEALLLRKGIQPLNQDEFLQVVDLSLAGKPLASGLDYDPLAHSHILTGLEPHGIRELMKKGFDVDNGTMQDSRAILLSASLDANNEKDESQSLSQNAGAIATWAAGLSNDLIKSFASETASAASLGEAILNLVCKRFSNLILMPLDRVNDTKPLAQYGMDSMIAAEYRTWFWTTFKVDIPFLEILSSVNCLKTLAGMVEVQLKEGSKQT